MESLHAWILGAEARPLLPHVLIEQLVDRLCAELPLWRVSTGIRTTHPEVSVVSLWWTEEVGMQIEDVTYGAQKRELNAGPIPLLYESGEPYLRWSLAEPTGIPLLDRIREQGATDYLLLHLPGERDQAISFATRAVGGFTDSQLELLIGLRIPLSVRWDLALARHSRYNLLRAYLGNRAAMHVLQGNFRRTHGQRVSAIVFTCDLRGFTARVDAGPLDRVLDDLDRYFECVSEPWIASGGEILKFVGDAVLGILPLGHSPEDAASRALKASRAAFRRLEVASDGLPGGRPPLEMGWVLHAGEVAYGNIGSRARVDFTVIGPVVNEASRLEKLTKTVAPLLVSEAFARLLPDAASLLEDVGTHALRGVAHPVQLYTPSASSSSSSSPGASNSPS